MPECFCGSKNCHWCGNSVRIAELEKENANLKVRIAELEKENAKLKTSLINRTHFRLF